MPRQKTRAKEKAATLRPPRPGLNETASPRRPLCKVLPHARRSRPPRGVGRYARHAAAWPGRSGVTRHDLAHHLCEARFPSFTVFERPLLQRGSGMSSACAFCKGGAKRPHSQFKDDMCLRGANAHTHSSRMRCAYEGRTPSFTVQG